MLSLILAATGIFISTITYWKPVISAEWMKVSFRPLYRLLWNKYFLDDLYVGFFVQKVLLGWNQALAYFDDKVIDGIFVDGWAQLTLMVRTVVGKFDDIVVDRILVDGTGNVAAFGGWVLRLVQTGRVQQYLVVVFLLFGVLMFVLR